MIWWLTSKQKWVTMTYIPLFILEAIWCINMIPLSNESIWLDAWPKKKSGSLWPIFHDSVLPYILKAIWCINIIPWNTESVRCDAGPQNKSRSLWPILRGSVILPYILKAFWCINMIPLSIMTQYDLMLDLKMKVGRCDLCFMFQWFYLMFWKLFDV